MYLPSINRLQKGSRTTIEFKGYNHNPAIADGEFYDMENLSSDGYPLLSPCKARGTVRAIKKPNGLLAHNKLAWVDGAEFYYDGVLKGRVSDCEKQMVAMGAYICIFPDKVYYNTATDKFASLENSVSVTGATITANSITAAGITGFAAYDAVEITGSTVDGNNKTSIVMSVAENKLVFQDNIFTECSGQNLLLRRTVPDMDFVTECDNRLWGCSNERHEICASKLGDPTNWHSFEGISTDSYVLSVGSNGNFTAAATHLGYVCFFKENHIHRLYGTKPSNYQLYDTECYGVAKGAHKSICIINGAMFFLTVAGIAVYSGSTPTLLNRCFGDIQYTDAVGGPFNGKYYVSLKDLSGNWTLFAYDTVRGMWHREDRTQARFMQYFDGKLYYISSSNNLMTVEGDDDELIEWSAQTGDFAGAVCGSSYVSALCFSVDIGGGKNMLEVLIQYDNSPEWERLKTIFGDGKKNVKVFVRPRRCEYFRLRLHGYGDIKLYGMTKTVRGGSNKT